MVAWIPRATVAVVVAAAMIGGCGEKRTKRSSGDEDDRPESPASSRTIPHTIPPLEGPGPVEIGVGSLHACVRNGSGSVVCWGSNMVNEIRRGSGGVLPPTVIEGISAATSLAVSDSHACAVHHGGGVLSCWGSNLRGGVGLPRILELATVHGDYVEVVAGNAASCARSRSRGWECFGGEDLEDDGRLRRSDPAKKLDTGYTTYETPAPLDGIDPKATTIALGGGHACALQGNGEVVCWGRNNFDQGAAAGATAPLGAPGRVTAIDAGFFFTCALLESAKVFCRGRNDDGILGQPPSRKGAGVVPGLSDVVEIAAATDAMCALRGDGQVFCWGNDRSGQLGDGGGETRHEPQPVPELTNVARISLSLGFGCAITRDQRVLCWGRGDEGQLGPGRGAGISKPVVVALPPP